MCSAPWRRASVAVPSVLSSARFATIAASISPSPDDSLSRQAAGMVSPSCCARGREPKPPPRPRAGSSAPRRAGRHPDQCSLAPAHLASRSAWCATGAVISGHGSWSGTVWNSASILRQRILSLWLKRLSTDRVKRQARDAFGLPSPGRGGSAPRSCAAPGWGEATNAAFTVRGAPPPGRLRRPPSPKGGGIGPLVIAGRRGNAEELVAVDAPAERLGLKPGMALAQARAMHPDLVVAAEDRAGEQKLLDDLVDWCQRYTPLVAVDPPDGILLDISGCAHLFGGEEHLVDDLARRVAHFGFTLRAAIASTIGAASAAARFTATTIIAGGEERELLAPLRLSALRLPDETVAALNRVGLKRIGEILDLPRA